VEFDGYILRDRSEEVISKPGAIPSQVDCGAILPEHSDLYSVLLSSALPISRILGKTVRKVLSFSFLRESGPRGPSRRNATQAKRAASTQGNLKTGNNAAGRWLTGQIAEMVVHSRGIRIGEREHISRQNRKVEQEKTMANNDSGASGLGWFLAGLGVGALIGVLYAPKAGKETREDLANAEKSLS